MPSTVNTIKIAAFLLQTVTNISHAQIHIEWNDYISISSDHSFYLDTITKDTLYNDRLSSQYFLTSMEGIELKRGSYYGGMGTKCGCTPKPHGQWIERYRSGTLKETGEYDCNRKIGTWHYYF